MEILPEAPEEQKQNLTEIKEKFVKAEVNFLQYPIGSLDKRYKGNSITYEGVIPYEQGNIEFKWTIGGGMFGLPGPSAIELDNVINKLLQDPKRKINGQVPKWIKTTYYELAKETHSGINGRVYNRLKNDLRKLATSSIVSKSAYYQKDKKIWGELIFNKYQAIALKDESLPEGVPESEANEKGKAGMVYIVLSDIYWENLKTNYTKKINYDFMMKLENATFMRIYQLLSLGFQTRMIKDIEERECLNYNYIEFCGRLPMKTWIEKRQAKLHLNRYLKKFIENGYLKSYVFEFEGQQERWFIRFYPGQKALEELDIIQGQRLLFDIIEPKVRQIEQKKRELVVRKGRQVELESGGDSVDESAGTTKAVVVKYKGQGSSVKIAGSFNNWEAEEMAKFGENWSIILELVPGEHQYKLIVDGEWILDPCSPKKVTDEQGNENSVLIVGST